MKILSADFVISNGRADMCPHHELPEYAFIGRSNVGKSSLINMLTGRKALAMTSSTPGKTMLINHFLINKGWYLVDLPGYGYAKRGKREMEKLQNLIEHYVLEREELTQLFVLIDSRLEPQRIDLIIFTKADKSKPGQLKSHINAFLHTLGEEWEELPPHFVTSSNDGTGRDELLNYIEQVNKSL